MSLEFSAFLRRKLSEKAMTQIELSRQSGIPQEQVSRYARGSSPNVDSYRKLCKGMPELRDFLDEDTAQAS